MIEGNSHGSFLIRRSESRTGSAQNLFALSIRDGDLIRHYRIKSTDHGRYFIARKSEFNTLTELVDYYSHSSDELGMVKLREPCVKVSLIYFINQVGNFHVQFIFKESIVCDFDVWKGYLKLACKCIKSYYFDV